VAPSRYRCAACGNLTLGGDLNVEDEQVLSEVVEEVVCRWCGSGSAIEVVADAVPGGPEGGRSSA
jgi:DNA-directed RNA polymerase subunit RPC12/RpoP